MPYCCINDFASLSADFTTPHFSVDLSHGKLSYRLMLRFSAIDDLRYKVTGNAFYVDAKLTHCHITGKKFLISSGHLS